MTAFHIETFYKSVNIPGLSFHTFSFTLESEARTFVRTELEMRGIPFCRISVKQIKDALGGKNNFLDLSREDSKGRK